MADPVHLSTSSLVEAGIRGMSQLRAVLRLRTFLLLAAMKNRGNTVTYFESDIAVLERSQGYKVT